MMKRTVSILLACGLMAISSVGCAKKTAETKPTKPAATANAKPAAAKKAEARPAVKKAEVAAKPAAAKPATAKPTTAKAAATNPALLEPGKATAKAPAEYKVKFDTTKGDFVVEVRRDWAPKGADRFYNLVKLGFFNDVAFFRVIKGFMVQFGISGNPEVSKAWREAKITDDPVKKSNTRGMITFATAGPGTRTTQVFINYKNNARLDQMGFAPFGKVTSGMEVVDNLNGEYGEGAPMGKGPSQGLMQTQGNSYLKAHFPNLDYVKTATIVTDAKAAPAKGKVKK